MELLALAEVVYASRGTEDYPALLARLPEGCRDSYHKIIQKGAQYVVTLFLAQRSVESVKEMNVEDLQKEDDETLEFSYWREVSRWTEVQGKSEVVRWSRDLKLRLSLITSAGRI